MNPSERGNDSAAVIDAIDLDDEDRHACSTRESSQRRPEEPSEREPRTHCDHSRRELYRHHFPADL